MNYRMIGGDGKEYGPVTGDQLRQWRAEGRVVEQTQILAEGSADWKPLSAYPELAGAVVASPPAVSATHQLSAFPVALTILLHYLTCGIFTFIWLNLMHGKLPRMRPDDPSAGKAVGFCFIPFYNLYWIFFTFRRLCLRLDEQRIAYGLPPSDLRGLATAACILQVIPYVNVLFGLTILTPTFAGMLQASVNELARTSAKHGPCAPLPAAQPPAPGMSAGVVAAIICACLVPCIGLMAALAIPGFVKARKQSQGRRIINDTRQLDAAIDQWALEKGKKEGTPLVTPEIASYLKVGWKETDILGNPYQFGPVGPKQILISPATKEALAGTGIDWGAF